MSRRASDWMFYLAPEAWERYKILDMHDDLKQSQLEASHARARPTQSVETLEERGKVCQKASQRLADTPGDRMPSSAPARP